jgi:hypothetical protein
MSGPSAGRRSEREAAGLVGDAVMSSLEDLVERLRDGSPDPQPHRRPLPARAAADLVGALVAEVVPAVLSRLDPDLLLDQVDVQRVVERVDVDAIARRIDLDALAARLDVDALLARVDVDELVRRVDLGSAAREAIEGVDLGEVIRESTATLGSDVVEDLRVQAMRADALVARLVDRVIGRSEPRDAAIGPDSRVR